MNYFGYGLLALLIGGCCFLLVDCAASKAGSVPAIVVDRVYEAARTHTGTGFVNGKTVVTTSTTPAKWLVVVDISGTVEAIDCDKDLWAQCVPGQPVTLGFREGRISGVAWFMHVESIEPVTVRERP